MHCASLGEFEQGRPVLEKIRNEFPSYGIMLTFFSPSGYEFQKNYKGVDAVMYLPFDTPRNAADFISILNPSLALFIKYEYWHFYLENLRKNKIPAVLISAVFRSSQPFFQWWGGFYRNMLEAFSCLFVQDRHSVELLSRIGYSHKAIISGDTRFDRVLEIATKAETIPAFEGFQFENILIAGSTWEADERLLQEWHKFNPSWHLILVPHDVLPARIKYIRALFPDSITYSGWDHKTQWRVLIIDQVGMLSKLYRYATLCYVGGGFSKKGHHNILEAAVYGKAVATGPYFEKFRESVELKKLKGSFAVSSGKELVQITKNSETGIIAGNISRQYVLEKAGATGIICKWLQENRLLTNA